MNRCLLLAATIIGATILGASTSNCVQAAERLLFPEDFPGLPAYLEVPSSVLGFTDQRWACIPVYRDLSGIPEDFNLLDFLDNASPAHRMYAQSIPLHVNGFVVRQLPPPAPPQTLYIQGNAGMPVLFVRWDDLLLEIADGELYVNELLSMDVRYGVAEMYIEEIQVIGGAQVPSHRRVTFGHLMDGTRFLATYSHGSSLNVDRAQVHIRFYD